MRREIDMWIQYKQHSSWGKKATAAATIWGNYFLMFLQQKCNISEINEITSTHINLYRKEIEHFAPYTQQTYRSKCVSFFKWCLDQNIILSSPVAYWPSIKIRLSTPKILTLLQVEKMLKSIDVSTFSGIQNRAIIEIFYATGLRIAELKNVNFDDLDSENDRIAIRSGKCLKDRVVPISRTSMFWVKLYIKDVRPHIAQKGTESLFVSHEGTRIHSGYIYKIFEEISKNIGTYVHPHLLRHTCATHLMEANVPIVYIQSLLGHANLTSTQRYLTIQAADRKKAFDRAHPRENWSLHPKN